MSSWSVGVNPYASVAMVFSMVKSLGDLARLTVRAAAYLLGQVGRENPVKVAWCGGRPAKLVKYFYSKWMWRSSIPLGCLMVTAVVDFLCGQNTSVMACFHIIWARPGRRLFGLAERATYHKMSTVYWTSYVATPTYYRILSTRVRT